MVWQRIVPVVVSIGVIVLIAILQEHSKVGAAITATMPLTVPLSLWIVYAAEGGERAGVAQYTGSLLLGIWPTVIFIVVVWLAARAGWGLIPIIAAGYAAWALGVGLLFVVRQVTGW